MIKKISLEKSREIINELRLKASFARDLSLLGYSTVAASYRDYLGDLIGFNYQAFGILKNHKTCCSIADLSSIEKPVEKFLVNENQAKEILNNAFKIYKNSSTKIENIFVSNTKPSLNSLKNLLEQYRSYSAGLGVYNIVYRAISDNSFSMRGVSDELINKLAAERNIIGALFPRIEEFLKRTAPMIEKDAGMEKDSILNITYTESQILFKITKPSEKLIQSAFDRQQGWFYLNIFKGDEYINSSIDDVEKLYSEYFSIVPNGVKELKGESAYQGKVRGTVRVLPLLNIEKSFEFNTGDILVSVHTNPSLMLYIEKCSAIVTDEGGILSHAAIISREMKKPCIIGTKIATKVFKDGDLVEVDAQRGVVRLLNRKK